MDENYDSSENSSGKNTINRNGFLIVIGIVVFAIISWVGGHNSTQEIASTPIAETQALQPPILSKSVSVNKNYKINGLSVSIKGIIISENKVEITTELKNATKNEMSFYPDQGSIVIDSMQLDANMFMSKGDLGGDIFSGVEKSGAIVFSVPENQKLIPDTVKQITLHWGSVTNNSKYSSKPFDATIEL